MVLLVSGKISFEAMNLITFPVDARFKVPVNIFLNVGPNAGTWLAACEQPTNTINDLETGVL